MPAIISAGLVIDLITEEKQQQTLDTLRSTPATLIDIIGGKIVACIVLIPLQVLLWLTLLTINGIKISGLFEILLHITLASTGLILIAAIIAIYYMDRTKAQFIFSSATIIVLLFILAIPANPVNQIVLLSMGGASQIHWLMMITTFMGCILLIILIKNLIRRIDKSLSL
jgi:ABC-2 type transport system permease protein